MATAEHLSEPDNDARTACKRTGGQITGVGPHEWDGYKPPCSRFRPLGLPPLSAIHTSGRRRNAWPAFYVDVR